MSAGTHRRAVAAATGLAAATFAVWIVFSWPLARRLSVGIPSSSQNIEIGAERRMVPGDHLQLFYHYWLAADMLSGRTPWFHNIYEFNTGDDAERFRLHAHYAPMSWVFALGSVVLPRAAAYNLTGLFSLWLTVWLTWRLARRHTEDPVWAAAAGVLAVLLPYRWAQLLGGSPAGHAMAWVPLICLGVDIAVRELRVAGAALAGIGLLFAAWGDSHVFFFGALGAAGWALVAMLGAETRWKDAASARRLIRLLLAGLVFVVPAVLMLWLKTRHLAETTAAVERTLAEVRIFSPSPRDFFRRAGGGLPGHVYIGFALPVLTAVLTLWQLKRPTDTAARCRRRAFWLLIGLMGLIGLLAMGPRGPLDGLVWRAASRALPPYRWVRQPAKVLCLLPTYWPLALALGASNGLNLRRRLALPVTALAVVAIAADYRGRVSATVCLLDAENAAYRAVAEAAAGEGRPARALVLPIWPGDAAESSAYSYYASLYRIRLANGYSPAIRRRYLATFYRRFRNFNHGDFDAEGLDELWRRGIRAIVIHEDSSEKVSPFPAGFLCTVASQHPRLRLLARDGRVWAYALTPPTEGGGAEGAAQPAPLGTAMWAPSRRLEGERGRPRSWELTDPACSGGAHGALSHPSDLIEFPRVPVRFAPDVAWRLRVRGQGTLNAEWAGDSQTNHMELIVKSPDAWSWLSVSTPRLSDDRAALRLSRREGRVELDVALFVNDAPLNVAVDPVLRLPASWFFRAGHLVPGPGGGLTAVRLERDRDPSDRVFYGPWRPLAPGRYRARLQVRVPEPTAPGIHLGDFAVEQPPAGSVPIKVPAPTGGSRPEISFVQTNDIPLIVSFRFSRAADLVIEALELEAER
ncbi:MAG: phage holin family protein [Kiritimatiellae bacterium]|nr:phage holin family protein [Kiritimatiellia bacterium]